MLLSPRRTKCAHCQSIFTDDSHVIECRECQASLHSNCLRPHWASLHRGEQFHSSDEEDERRRPASGANAESVDALTFDKARTVASVGGKGMPNKAPIDGWRCVELLVDSGAVDNVADPRSLPEYRLRESEGSRSGLHYLAASNGMIKNQGEQLLTCRSHEGIPFKVRMQSAEVSRPILSVIRLMESGKEVIFRKNGGIIRDPKTKMSTEFERKHGVYILRMWVRTGKQASNNPESGFAWLG